MILKFRFLSLLLFWMACVLVEFLGKLNPMIYNQLLNNPSKTV